jgi:hypothetical protein
MYIFCLQVLVDLSYLVSKILFYWLFWLTLYIKYTNVIWIFWCLLTKRLSYDCLLLFWNNSHFSVWIFCNILTKWLYVPQYIYIYITYYCRSLSLCAVPTREYTCWQGSLSIQPRQRNVILKVNLSVLTKYVYMTHLIFV